jgi:hypothetical protein
MEADIPSKEHGREHGRGHIEFGKPSRCAIAGALLPHLREAELGSLVEIVSRLVAACEPERMYLFGSRARGDQGPDSDFDLLVVVKDDAPSEQEQSHLAYQRLWGTGTAADVLVWPDSRFSERAHLRASLPGTVLREGKLLYGA